MAERYGLDGGAQLMNRILEFAALPSLGAQYAKALLPRIRRRTDAPELPRLEARVARVEVNAARLSAYRRECGFPADAPTLPATYPQVLAAPLHGALIAHDDFPFAPWGLVHVKSRIRGHVPLGAHRPLTIRCAADGLRPARSGFEFDLTTEVTAENRLAWESVTTVLVRVGRRRARPEGSRPAAQEEIGSAGPREVLWTIAADQGRRYAAVSGDYNPIHLSPLTARPFGFRQPIAHGMWALARVAAALGEEPFGSAFGLEVSFKRPVPLPSTAQFVSRALADRTEFELRGPDGLHVHLSGRAWRET